MQQLEDNAFLFANQLKQMNKINLNKITGKDI